MALLLLNKIKAQNETVLLYWFMAGSFVVNLWCSCPHMQNKQTTLNELLLITNEINEFIIMYLIVLSI